MMPFGCFLFQPHIIYSVSAYFSCVVKLLYNLLYMQVTIQLSCVMSEAERQMWRRPVPDCPVSTLEEAMALTIHSLDHTPLYLSDDTPAPAVIDKHEVENQVSVCILGLTLT